MWGFRLAIVGLALAVPKTASAIDGNRLHELCKDVEGFCAGYISAANDTTILPYESCVPKNVNYRQIVDVVQKFLVDHPEQRHRFAPLLIRDAIWEAFPCRPTLILFLAMADFKTNRSLSSLQPAWGGR
jgi:hypothetical protein